MRVLHFIDAAGRQSHPPTLALLGTAQSSSGGIEQQIVALGPRGFGDMARQAGAAEPVVLAVPYGRAMLGFASIRRRLSRQLGDMNFDLIHCWSVGTMTLATLLFRQTPRILTLTTSLDQSVIRWLNVLCADAPHNSLILPISNTVRRNVLSCGLSEDAVHVVRPAIDMAMVDFDERQTLRKIWGINSPKQKVVALISDPASHANTVDALMATLLADDTTFGENVDLKLLVHPDAHDRIRAMEILRHADRADQLVVEPLLNQPWKVLPGCDVVLSLEKGGGGLSLLWAMASNVPVVAEATYAISEIVEDRHSALLVKPGLIKALAHRICQVLGDSQLAWQLRDTARHEAYSFFSPNHYLHSLATIYQQMLERKPIEAPLLPVTGGLRFGGRA